MKTTGTFSININVKFLMSTRFTPVIVLIPKSRFFPHIDKDGTLYP